MPGTFLCVGVWPRNPYTNGGISFDGRTDQRDIVAQGRFNFDQVRVLLGESNAELRRGLRVALTEHGFRQILDAGSVRVAREALQAGVIDVMICDIAMSDGDICEIAHKVRHHALGPNPFVVIILLASAPEPDRVRRIIDAGVDSVLLKPLTIGSLLERIDNLIYGRKRFVVTTDYVGPDRRKGPRPGTQEIPTIDVPNPLRARAVGGTEMQKFQDAVDRSVRVINDQKIERHGYQIHYLVDKLMPLLESGAAPEAKPMVERLVYVAEDMSRRIKGSKYGHIGEMCLTMVGLAGRIRETLPNPDEIDVHLLPKLTQAIQRAFIVEAPSTNGSKTKGATATATG